MILNRMGYYLKSIQRFNRKLVLIVIWISILVLVGWTFDIKLLTQPIPEAAAMNPFTAICFILQGVALILLTNKSKKNTKRIIGYFLAFSTLIIATVILGGIFFESNIRIDTWLFVNKMDTSVRNSPLNFMVPNTAFSFIITAISLLLLGKQIFKNQIPSQYLALMVAFIAIISILGYLYNVENFYGFLKYFPMAIHTAIGFLLITLAILLTNNDKGFMSQFYGVQFGALLARKLIPAVLIIPIVFGFFRLYLEKKGYISDTLGVGLLVFSNIIIFLLIIWLSARELNKKDALRIKAEEDLRNSNVFLDAVFENIPNMLFIKDAKELRFMRFNRAGEKLLGYKDSDLLGKNDYDFFPKKEADFFVNTDMEIIKKGVLQEIPEERISTKNGERWLRTKKIPVFDKNKKPVFILGISEDITEQRKAEKLFQTTLNELSDYKHALDESAIVAITNNKGIIQQVNDNFCEISKYSREELLGQDHRILNSSYHSKAFIKDLWETISNGKVWNGEIRNKAKDGTFYWVKSTIVPFLDEQEKPYQFVAIRTDITEQKLLEEEIKQFNFELEQKVIERTEELAITENKFRNLFENAPESILVLDIATSKFIKANRNASILFNHSVEDFNKLGPKDISPKFQPDGTPSIEKAKKYIKKAFNGNKVVFEWTHCDSEGNLIPCEIQLALLPNTINPQIYASIINISERNEIREKLKIQFKELAKQNKKLEKQRNVLNITNNELQKTNKELDSFVYSTSHDLRAPLKSLLGLVSLIEEGTEEENTTLLMQIDMMKNSILKLDNFVEDILNYSRNSRAKMAYEEIYFEESIQEISKDYKYMKGVNEIDLKINIQQENKFVTDKGRLYVILNNIISNAIKYADHSKSKPFVSITITSLNNHAVIVIEDNGIGIDKNDKEKVFDMFYRATMASTGSGLGLYIVKEAVNKLNATIDIKSKLKKGTKFTITIPNEFSSLN